MRCAFFFKWKLKCSCNLKSHFFLWELGFVLTGGQERDHLDRSLCSQGPKICGGYLWKLQHCFLFSHTAGICVECCCFYYCSVGALNSSAGSSLPVSERGNPGNICFGVDAVSRLRFSDPREHSLSASSFVPVPEVLLVRAFLLCCFC